MARLLPRLVASFGGYCVRLQPIIIRALGRCLHRTHPAMADADARRARTFICVPSPRATLPIA